MTRRLLACALAVTMFAAPWGGAAAAASRIHIGVSKSVVDTSWPLEKTTLASPCTTIGHDENYCNYEIRYQGKALGIGVDYLGKQGAIEFDVDFDLNVYAPRHWSPGLPVNAPSPGAALYAQFLNGLLPPGARKSSCRSFHAHPDWNTDKYSVKAVGCMYTYRGKPILLAHYLTRPSYEVHIGLVALGKGYSYIHAS